MINICMMISNITQSQQMFSLYRIISPEKNFKLESLTKFMIFRFYQISELSLERVCLSIIVTLHLN